MVTGVNCSGIFDYEIDVDSPSIIWDQLLVTNYGITDDHCDIGSSQQVWVQLNYDYDGVFFDGERGSLNINGQAADWNTDTLFWYIAVEENEVQQRNYLTPSDFSDTSYGLTALSGTVSQSIVWDMVNVTLQPIDDRINVGDEANIQVSATYGYDSAPFFGSIVLNDTLIKDVVGQFGYTCESITDDEYGLTRFTANNVSIVYDKVSVTLEPINARSSLDQPASISVSAIYQYDGSSYDGVVALNDTQVKSVVGVYGYMVEIIDNDTFGITEYQTNAIQILFDRVDLQLSVEYDRLPVGDRANITWVGTYESDNAEFTGSITFNNTLTQSTVGTYYYTVNNMSDSQYGIIAFNSNVVSITFTDLIPLNAEVGRNHSINVGMSITFNASDSIGSMNIVDYQWDFGDGTTKTGSTPTHKYTNPGTYIVTLMVIDANGTSASDSTVVRVYPITIQRGNIRIPLEIPLGIGIVITICLLFIIVRSRHMTED
jgi:chitodextrinase